MEELPVANAINVAASVANFNKIMFVSLSTMCLKVKTRMSLFNLTKLVATSDF